MITRMIETAAHRHWLTVWKALVIASLIVAAAPPAITQADDLPSGEQVLNDYVKATGGHEAYVKHHNMVAEGTLEMAAMGLKGSLKTISAEPNLSRTITNVEGMGKSEQGFDGTTVWSVNPMEGPRVMEGEERDFNIRTATFNPEINWKQLYQSAECVGTEDVDGKTCYKVILTPPTGDPVTSYYDKDSKFLVRTNMKMKTAMGDMPIETSYDDFKEVDGQRVPFKTTIKVMGMQQDRVQRRSAEGPV
jgi:hypothetical protein